MNFRRSHALLPLICAALAAPALSHANEPAAKPAAKAKNTQPARKPAAKAKKPAPAPVVEAPLPDAPPEQLAAADQTYFGGYSCEFDQTLSVAVNPKHPGYVDVDFKKQVYVMKPVMSSTGALRLEDVKGRALMIQIANKSMLMDVKAGQRMVDECLHERQRAARLAMQSAPPVSSLGIDPAKAAAVAAAPAAIAEPAAPAASTPP
ncbi:hypothetical protein V4F39_05110 [Aquincola sp. MAHUQ-54]|uniref:Uncharacterized protein n=1 Tax=Aquincola agrisoli TaxID=3119538 RepID=A0AAW9Q999_9BURK